MALIPPDWITAAPDAGKELQVGEEGGAGDIINRPAKKLWEYMQLNSTNVKWYGASGSEQVTTGSITTGTNTLTLAAAIDFEDGQGILIAGAGAASADLITQISSGGGTVNLVLVDNASTTVSGTAVKHDDTTALQGALNAASAAKTFLKIPPGTYLFSNLSLGESFEGKGIIGYGREATILEHTGSANAIDMNKTAGAAITGVMLKDFELDVDADTVHGIYLNKYSRTLVENIYIKNESGDQQTGDAIKFNTDCFSSIVREVSIAYPSNYGIYIGDNCGNIKITADVSHAGVAGFYQTGTSYGIRYISPSAQSCDIGFLIDSGQQTSFIAPYFEGTVNELFYFRGNDATPNRNTIIGISDSSTDGIKIDKASWLTIIGGKIHDLLITNTYPGSVGDIFLFNVYIAGTITDNQGVLQRCKRGFFLKNSTPTSGILTSNVTTDANLRFRIEADGKVKWGDGSAAQDTNLYRNAANVLKTDDKLITNVGLGVGNSVANTNTPSGATAKAVEVFDASGNSIGYIPVYAAEW